MKQRLIAVHLLNDRSGSPLVFREALEALSGDYNIHLFTATPSGDGFLSGIPGIKEHQQPYRWAPNKLLTLFFFLLSQLRLFLKLLHFLKKGDTVYINTLLPFGAALAGKLRGCRVVYHVHEVSLKPAALKNFLTSVASSTAHKTLFVSRYVSEQYHFPKAATAVIYNALPSSFTKRVTAGAKGDFTVLMLCSLKAYKGVYHFLNIAKLLPELRFELVLNTSSEDFERFQKENSIPANCMLFPAQCDTIPFYRRAAVVMNLSKPDGWIETFGMTILEAMAFGIPVIVPEVGGPLELVTNGVEGFTINSSKEETIAARLNQLAVDSSLYQQCSDAARAKAATFSQAAFTEQIRVAFSSIPE